MKIYTKQGDQGFTHLKDGTKISKADILIQTLGDIDELSSCIGIARAFIKKNKGDSSDTIRKELQQMDSMSLQVQVNLILAGSIIPAYSLVEKKDSNSLTMNNQLILDLETNIDKLSEKLPPIKNFIIVEGSVIATQFHLARTICRRAERSLVALGQSAEINKTCLIYLNRLSDLLFQMARYINFLTGEEN